MPGSGTLPSAILSARITFRSQQRTPKPKSSCYNGNRHCFFGRSAPTKQHQNINSSSSKHTMPLFYSVERTVATKRTTKGHKTQIFLSGNRHCLFRRAVRSYPKNTKTLTLPLKHTMPLLQDIVEQTVVTERATKGHTNSNLPAWQPALLV